MNKPRVGCAIILKNEKNEVLLAKRAKEPFYGYWILPGGGVEFLEAFEDTAKREAMEELNVEIEDVKFFTLREIISEPNEHRIVIYCTAKYKSGKLTASSDVSEVTFVPNSRLLEISNSKDVTPTVASVLKEIAEE